MPQLLITLLTTGGVNAIYGYLGFGLFFVFVYQRFKTGYLYLNALRCESFWTLIVFGLAYCLLGEFTLSALEYYLVAPILAYAAGWIIVETSEENTTRIVQYMIYSAIVGFGIHALLNYAINIGKNRWELTDFFSGNIRAATGSGSINTLIFSLIIYFIFIEERKRFKIAAIFFWIISVLYALLLGNRTQFVIILIVFVVSLVLYFGEKRDLWMILKVTMIVMLVIGIVVILYDTNKFGIKTMVDSSNLMIRIKTDTTGADEYRFSSIAKGLDNLFEHPLGGMQDTSYYHNMWLDIGRVAGILPFMIMVVYSVIINSHAIRIFRLCQVDWFRYLILCVYLGIQINFFTEPILEGNIEYFLFFCVINGMVECWYTMNRNGEFSNENTLAV